MSELLDKPEQRILVVDDEAAIRALLTRIFGMAGYATEVAATAAEALEKARETPFDLALLDIRLPDTEGIELIAPLKQILPDVAVVVFTGYATLDSAIRALKAGADAYITKPVIRDEVVATVKDVLEKRRLQLENKRLYQIAQEELAERRKTEQALRDSEARFRSVYESASDGILIADKKTARFCDGNPRMLEMLGCTEAELTGLGVKDIHPPEDLDHALEEFRKMVAAESNFARRIPCLHKDGSIFVADISSFTFSLAGKDFLAGIFRDVTERERARERLETFCDLNRAIVTAQSLQDVAQGALRHLAVLVDWDRMAILQFAPDNDHAVVLGCLHRDSAAADITEDTIPAHELEDLASLSEGEPRCVRDLRNAHDGTRLDELLLAAGYCSSVDVPLVAEAEMIGCLNLASRTERTLTNQDREILMEVAEVVAVAVRQARLHEAVSDHARQLQETLEELNRTQRRLSRHERLTALGQFASGIVHEFNNAMSPIVGFSDILLKRPEILEDRKKLKAFLSNINTAALDAAATVEQLRGFYRSRQADEVWHRFDLCRMLRRVLSVTRTRWRHDALAQGARIELDAQVTEPLWINGHESELRRALTNLIFNAVDAMPNGGTLSVLCRPERGGALVEVRDTGDGMDEEVARRCLDPFFTTKQDRGTGLGLAMVYGCVQRHQGTVEFETAPRKGTAFRIYLPSLETPGDRPQEKPAEAHTRELSILVVEPDPRVRSVLTECLPLDGHAVATADTGKKALDALDQAQYDVIMTAQGLPDMGGEQLADRIKACNPGMPVVLVTGFVGNDGDPETDGNAINAVLRKPVTLDSLRTALAELCEQ